MNYVLTPTAVRKLRRVLAPTPGNTGAGGAPATIHPDDFPPPFTVRWAQSENNGQGAWVIWLCNQAGTFLVTVGRSRKTITDGITAAQTLPAGWYTMDDVSASGNQVWLNVLVPKGESTAPESVEISNTGKTDTSQRKAYSILVAQMSTDSATGARRVRQYVTSSVTFGDDEGGDVTLDEVSVNKNDDDEVQIKDWEDGTPASPTTIAQDINNPPSNASALVERDHNGELKYKGLGTLAELTGSYVTGEVTKTVVTNIEWNATNHTLDITKATVVIKDGTVKSWTEGQPVPTPTTPISSILGS